jgi:hypothetical protein
MVNHTCVKCLKVFDKKSTYDYHVNNKKRPCIQNNIDSKNLIESTTQVHTNPLNNNKDLTKIHTNSTQIKKLCDINNDEDNQKSCLYCGLVFARNDSLKRHIEKFCRVIKIQNEQNKEVLVKNNSVIPSIYVDLNNKTNSCNYCGLVFKRKDNLKRHIIDRCKVKKIQDEQKAKDEKLESQDKEIEELKNIVLKLNKKVDKEINNLLIQNIDKEIEIIEENNSKNKLIDIIVEKNIKIEELKNMDTSAAINTFDKKKFDLNNNIYLIIDNILIDTRQEDNYINASQLCRTGTKKFSDWVSLESTKELINELSKSNNQIDVNNNVKFIEKSTVGKLRETWIHPDLAIQLAQWISPKFALLVSKWFREIMQNKELLLNKKIKTLEDLYVKKQPRVNYPESNVIYILTTEANKKERIFIVGKAKKLKTRLSTYNKTCEHEVIYYKSCGDFETMDIVEKAVIHKLKDYKEKANRDRFILPKDKTINYFKNIIDETVKLFNKK